MCGINGIFLKDRERDVSRSDLVEMRDSMVHRGPDDQGVMLDRNLGLGHRRLSIIGLTTGHQPMSNESQTLWIVYNGETYNYEALRESLIAKGYQFQTTSDTEVVLNLYAEYGPDCVSHMNGLFAFAVWDSRKRELFLSRDRLGIKPLYYKDDSSSFIFASEIKSILHSGQHTASVNVQSVYEYFMFRAVVGEKTMFDGVKSLPPGHSLFVSEKGMRIEQYWDGRSDSRQSVTSMDDAAGRLEELLSDAVRIRLMSEVPLGTFCSGGVDSSLVTALAARHQADPINTFSVGFDEAGFDESQYARTVSNKYGTIHHEIRVGGGQFADLLPDLIRLNDEPLNFANSVHIYALSKLAKQFVTVVLTGEGADELFLGYPRYLLPRLSARLDRVRWLASPMLSAGAALTGDGRFTKLRRYLDVLPEDRVVMNAASSDSRALSALLNPDVPRAIEFRRNLASSLTNHEELSSALSVNDQKTYLVSILNRQDKMSMGTSIEARVPFLDYRIVEFANQLQGRFKTRGWETKQIVKKAALRYLPRNVVHRRKSGFGVPISSYFRDSSGLGGMTEQLINDTEYEAWLNKDELSRLYREHREGSRDHSELLWTAVNFLIWKEQYSL